jgi:asparagine synthase (glutamine-hydrolysing)
VAGKLFIPKNQKLMCGIAGMIGCGDLSTLKRMSAVMQHRGPDGQGAIWFNEQNAGLAHNRLAIIDLSSAGAQPMQSLNGRYWIVFNGEIYNHAALREELEALGHSFRSNSDTEVLLNGLIEWGKGCLNRLNGMFAFAWFDTHTGVLVAARDHLGIKPLYFTQKGGGLLFASEIKAILQCSFVPVVRDDEAMKNPSRFMVSPFTGFKGIYKLRPAHVITFHNGSLKEERYWHLNAEEREIKEKEAVEHVGSLIEKAVERQMVSDRPIGAFLSGGLDSSLICALMKKHTCNVVDAFTISFSQKDQKFERASEDIVYARRVAADLGMNIHEFEIEPDISKLLPLLVWHTDEPLSDPAAINTYLISKAAREMGIVVLLNGVGGDEVFGGYRKHLACLRADTYQRWCPGPLSKFIERTVRYLPVANQQRGFARARMAKRFLGYASLPRAERFLSSDLSLSAEDFTRLYKDANYYDTPFWRSQHAGMDDARTSYLTRMCLNDTHVFLPDHNLTYSDKASMAAGIETRPPLVDKDVVETMFHMPPEFRIRKSVQKYLLKKVGEKHLPHDVVHRPKASFNSPLRSWIRGPLAPLVDRLLSEDQVSKRSLYNPQEVRRMIQADRLGKSDYSMWIWTLLTVEVWHRTFLDRTPTGPIQLT